MRRPRLSRPLARLVLAAVLLTGVATGALSARRAAWRAHLARLAAYAGPCLSEGRAAATDWSRLALDDRRTVCLTLLREPAVEWDATLDEAWLVELLAEELTRAARPDQRAAAARALGELASHTPVDPRQAPPAGLDTAVNELQMAVDRDADTRVRTAAVAALLRLRPVGRAFDGVERR